MQQRSSAWAPFRQAAFTMLWFAQLGSNLGSWMQSVGAQWFLVERSHSATLVAWVQTAGLLPVLLLSVVAGVLADGLDRRLLLTVMNAGAALVAAVLFVLTLAGALDPFGLLGITFLLGCLSALSGPAWQAIQPELVPRDEIPAASSLGSVTVNGARVIGPALAGAIIAVAGPAPVFALNAVSFLGVIVALLLWKRTPQAAGLPREAFTEAVAAGIRYVRAAPGVRRILLRAGLFAVPASAFWALLPVVAQGRLGLGAGGYGLLLGALGVGSVLGVVITPWLRRRLSTSAALALSALVFAVGAVAAAVLPLVPLVVLLLPTGIAWIASLTTLNATMQLTVADWVRARALGVYFVVFLGGQGVGAFLWGLLAGAIGPVPTLLVSAVLLLAVAASVRWLPLHAASGTLDRTVVSADGAGPALVFQPDPTDPVAVVGDYRVEPADVPGFLRAMRRVELTRRRAGAYLWRLEREGSDPAAYREEYTVRSWSEYRRGLQQRRTGYDAGVLDAVARWRGGEAEWFPVALPRGAAPAATVDAAAATADAGTATPAAPSDATAGPPAPRAGRSAP